MDSQHATVDDLQELPAAPSHVVAQVRGLPQVTRRLLILVGRFNVGHDAHASACSTRATHVSARGTAQERLDVVDPQPNRRRLRLRGLVRLDHAVAERHVVDRWQLQRNPRRHRRVVDVPAAHSAVGLRPRRACLHVPPTALVTARALEDHDVVSVRSGDGMVSACLEYGVGLLAGSHPRSQHFAGLARVVERNW
ncbi:hypothetical protein [Dactylosporangium sp. NPDC000521]|uniref:hypothetical protein n=1 Tax=Dactylosporangium sp. NPDC000521 TaxID=3363975 RepID=UPI0036A65F3F